MPKYTLNNLDDMVRSDPFGPQRLGLLRENLRLLEYMQRVEHDSDGAHNALEVARTTARLTYAAGTWSMNGNNANLTSIATGAYAGEAELTLASGKFNADMSIIIASAAESGLNKPCLARAVADDATTVRVAHNYLSSALGAGNTWLNSDEPMDVLIYSRPYSDTTAFDSDDLVSFYPYSGSDFRVLNVDHWNPYVRSPADRRYMIDVEHIVTGLHDTREVSAAIGRASWDGATWTLDSGTSGFFASISALSTGVVRVTFSGALGNDDYSIFPNPDYYRDSGISAANDISNVVAPISTRSTTKCDFYLYQYDYSANTWARADFDFNFSMHYSA